MLLSIVSPFLPAALRIALHFATRADLCCSVSTLRVGDNPPGTGTNGLNERIGLKSSTEEEGTLIPVDDHALLIPAATGSGRAMVTFSAGRIRLRSARLAKNSANIQHAPIAARL
jgi:hypothetical protein